MCGIAGLVNSSENWEENIKAMIFEMRDRGPDDCGIWSNIKHDIVLGHTRLAIHDLQASGHQPMVSANGRYVIVLNGEIYNFKELKNELKEIDFRGTSDTEVLLEIVNKYGIYSALEKCKGMFAFCVYDKKINKLYLARDRMGEKPLYYGRVSGGFCFASNINAISKIRGFQKTINKKVLKFYIANKYIPAPYSIYESIYKLEAGNVLELNAVDGNYCINSYWDLCKQVKLCRENPFKGTYEEAKTELEIRLKKSVKEQMAADVSVGAFLSGGIDSSLISALMQGQASQKVKTFTIGFPDEKDNEAKEARIVAKYLGTEHSELLISEDDLKSVIPKLPQIFGEPFGDTSELSTYLVSKLAKEKVTVSLSGDAGDELFCGYDSYDILNKRWKVVKKIPFKVRLGNTNTSSKFYKNQIYRNVTKAVTYFAANSIGEYAQLLDQRDILVNSFVKTSERLETKFDRYMVEYQAGDVTDLMVNDMIRYLPDDILTKVDRTAMSNSLETRVPFLDKDVIEFVLSLPIEYKYYQGVRKRILKDILFDYIPREIIERPKRGFHVPVEKWILEGELRDWAEELLKYGRVKCKELFDFDAINYAWLKFVNQGQWLDSLWNLLIFLDWHKYNYEDKG